MKKIEWSKNLSVGIELIDDQHKMLIKHLNDLSEAIDNTQGPKVIGKTLNFLIDYTNFHFSTEENHMKVTNFSGLGEHKKAHEKFKNPLHNLENDFKEEGATHSLAEAIDNFLIDWLIKHIRGIDQEFGKFLKINSINLT